MPTITVNRNLGVTLENIPDGIFQFMSTMPIVDNGVIKIQVVQMDNQQLMSVIEQINILIRLNGYNPFTHNIGNVYAINPAPPQPAPVQAQAEVATTPTAARPANPGYVEGPTDGYGGRILTLTAQVAQAQPLNDEAAIMAITELMESNRTNEAKTLHDKVREYNNLWTSLINKKRAIDELTLVINQDPIINGLMTQVREISQQDNLIERIFFLGKDIVFITKELVTDGEFGGYRRVIGRMECKIGLKALVGKSSQTEAPLSITNLDRKYRDDEGKVWDCGHVSKDMGLCMGTVGQEQLLAAYQSRDLHSIIEVVIRFIKNPNPADSWGEHIVNWPEYRGRV